VKACGIDLSGLRQDPVREEFNTIMKFRIPKEKAKTFF
jgi:hypothetical protein